MSPLHSSVIDLLLKLEQELKQLALWQSEIPSPQALASQQPFCVDTLAFEQWLQFVFLPKMYQLIESHQALPTSIALCPMAEEAFSQYGNKVATLINLIAELDELLSGTRQQTQFL